jgi:sugar lactone lactonase YvrE
MNPKEERFNDGKVLSDGTFVFGSMNLGSLE